MLDAVKEPAYFDDQIDLNGIIVTEVGCCTFQTDLVVVLALGFDLALIKELLDGWEVMNYYFKYICLVQVEIADQG